MSRRYLLRADPNKSNVKWTPQVSSSDVTAGKKQATICKSANCSTTNGYSTKKYSIDDAKQHLLRIRTSRTGELTCECCRWTC